MAGKRYAILIASGKYPNEPKLNGLDCPEQDVIALNELLAAPELGGFETPLVFINQPSYEILPEINRLLSDADYDDLILIYFSGHGKRNRKNHLHLTTKDTQLNMLETTSIPVQTLDSLFKHSYSKKMILLLDCCNSGAASKLLDNEKGGDDDDAELKRMSEEEDGIFIMTASAADQTAKEGKKYSIFTKHIVEGIRSGEADSNKDGLVNMDELYSYVREKVRAENSTTQKPQRYFQGGSALVISRSGTEALEKRLEKAIETFLALVKDKRLRPKVAIEALHVLSIPKRDMTTQDEKRSQLAWQLAGAKISALEFMEEWFTHIAPKKEQPAVVLVKPAPIILPAPKQVDIFRDNITGMELVYIPAGSFMMGSSEDAEYHQNDEGPVHEVCLDAFYMGRYQVTQAQWQKIMRKNPSKFQKGDTYPVERVSWNNVREFILELNKQSGKNYRLPTEAEWEYACKAGGSGQYDLDAVAWYKKNSDGSTHPFGERQANDFGLYDMLGNVWEWCADWYDDSDYYKQCQKRGIVKNPQGPEDGEYRVLRGGSYSSNPQGCHTVRRGSHEPGYKSKSDEFGFRLVLPF